MNNNTQGATILNYCLGLLDMTSKTEFEKQLQADNTLMAEVRAMQERLSPYITPEIKTPAPSLRDKTWALIDNVHREKNMDMSNLPLLNKYTDCTAWDKVAKQLLPKKLDKTRPYMKVLTANERVTQILIATSDDFPEEEHDDLLESFIILEGECECHIGGQTVRVKAGGYLEIPLHTDHDVRIVSDGIIGILQRINLTNDAEALSCQKG
ncbi:MAG: cupin domain-containing protein [Bacteroidetes bacterium]|nr:cupin domain-containing protein [Bacteroidota bacterium]